MEHNGMTGLFLAALGRSGTTLMMRYLAAHPGIVAFAEYPLELRLLAAVAHPEETALQEAIVGFVARSGLTFSAVRDVPGLLTSTQALDVYRALASADNKEPSYIAEKYPPRLDITRAIAAFPRARILVLLRDPRDVLASARTFDARRGYHGFVERAGDDEVAVVDRYRDLYDRLLQWQRTIPGVVSVRYEDLLAGPHEFLQAIFDALDLPSDVNVVDRVVRDVGGIAPGRHRTSVSAEASVMRWREDLPADTIQLFSERMGDQLVEMGYPI